MVTNQTRFEEDIIKGIDKLVLNTNNSPISGILIYLFSTLSTDMTGSATLVTILCTSVRTILHYVSNLVAVIASVLLLFAISGDVTSAVAPVTTVLLLVAVPGQMAVPVAFVTLSASAATTTIMIAASPHSTASIVPTPAIALRTLTSKMTYAVASVAHAGTVTTANAPATTATTVIYPVTATAGTLAGKVAGLITSVTNIASTPAPVTAASTPFSTATAGHSTAIAHGTFTSKVSRFLAPVTNHIHKPSLLSLSLLLSLDFIIQLYSCFSLVEVNQAIL